MYTIRLSSQANMKRYMALLGAAMFFVACVSLYLMMESVSSGRSYELNAMNGVPGIEDKIKQIEQDLQRNHDTIDVIKDTIREFAKNGDKAGMERVQHVLGQVDKSNQRVAASLGAQTNYSLRHGSNIIQSQEMCSFAQEVPPATDIQMVDLFDILPFDNPDGGAWKQGYPISYSPNQWNDQHLMVYVVPHSHNDPGWIKTFDRYYSDQTRHILNNMVDKLEAYPKMRFIYAEMSFFSMWWDEIDESKRGRVKELLKQKRLELVTGGWVMTDEANAHYYAMLDQMIEGNQWLLNQVGVKPESGWAIDPFGHSSTMPYLLHEMGFNNMLVQRIHYSIKKHFSKNKQLEFMWRQNWDHSGNTDILCHMMPFYSYDVPHTCGPEPAVCCQFDFKRLPGGKISCPWKTAPVPITDANVEQKAQILLDQYRKKSQLYKNNVVLIPLGDDFRYDKSIEWDQQYSNYQKLFDYMNSRKDWNVQAQFGTLSDYFHAIHYRAGSQPGSPPPGYPVLGGDFFSYSDRDDHYWTGYFTSRPFYKRQDRELEAHLRGGEILYSLAVMHARHLGLSMFPEEKLMQKLVKARRSLGLYQHHDGITGTAKDAVVIDYGNRMLEGIQDMKTVMTTAAEFLIFKDKSQYQYSAGTPYFDVDEHRMSHDSLPEKTILMVNDVARTVAFYNSLSHSRQLVVRVYISDPFVEVKDSEGQVLASQCDPFWETADSAAQDKFRLTFVATVPALGLSTYSVRRVTAGTNPQHSLAAVYTYNIGSSLSSNKGGLEYFPVIESTGDSIGLENSDLMAQISSKTGTLQGITIKEGKEHSKTEVQFLLYGTTSQKDKSGAYLFLPDGPAKPVDYMPPAIKVLKGPVVSEMTATLPNVQHTLSLYNSPGIDGLSVDVFNLVDIRQHSNRELVMRVKTDIDNKDTFYTDLNGFQIQKRKTYAKLPLQANYYPMPTISYLEDQTTRFSILSGQSLGCASLQKGWLEVMQDRRLNQDDNRGLAQGVLDNKRTPNRFRFLLERRPPEAKPLPTQPVGYQSLVSHLASQEFIHPVMVLPQSVLSHPLALLPEYHPLQRDLSCDLHTVNLRTMQHSESDTQRRYRPQDSMALILHRLGVDCSFPARAMLCPQDNGKVSFGDLFQTLSISSVESTSLNLIHDHSQLEASATVQVPVMEIKAYKLKTS